MRILKETRKLLCAAKAARGNTLVASVVLIVYTSPNHCSDAALHILNQLLIDLSHAFSYQLPCYMHSISYYLAFSISYFIYRLSACKSTGQTRTTTTVHALHH